LPGSNGGGGGTLIVIQDLLEGRRLEANQQRFLANAAHELKTPLTTILGAAELLLEDRSDPEVLDRLLRHIHGEASRMRRLSETMLRLARTGADQREPRLSVVDLEAVAQRAAGSMEALAHRARLALSVEGRGARARADEEWLEEALLVLLSNAIKHSEPGGRVRVRAEGSTIAVEDEGEGIPAEDLPHVLERFYRGRGGSEGFGLGLPICKEIVERMGGEVRVESEEGAGTRVEIRLPQEGEEG
jgi:signal transduction histidine kinase